MLLPLFPQLTGFHHFIQHLLRLNFFELSRDEVGVERTLCRLHSQQWCDVRCVLLNRDSGEARIRLRDQECHHGGRDGREKKDKQYGNNTHPDDAPIIQNMKFVGGVLFSGSWFHLS